MEHATIMQKLSPGKDLRPGQVRVIEHILQLQNAYTNVRLPTGYGKTHTANTAFVGLMAAGTATHMLYIVPSVGQLDQYIKGSTEALEAAGYTGPYRYVSGVGKVYVTDIGAQPEAAMRRRRTDQCRVFATTIQALTTASGKSAVKELMRDGKWFVVVDEYHHYGKHKTWGKAVNALPCVARLAMSATPHRKTRDGAFGDVDVEVGYIQAVQDGHVKPMQGHSAVLTAELLDSNNDIITLTYGDIEALGEKPEDIDRALKDRALRFSDMYVSPMVREPLNRLMSERARTGLPLQCVVAAMSVGHAKSVYNQIRKAYPDLSVDWAGTRIGDNGGRSDEENRGVLERFCAAEPGNVLDVLVQVNMAGEGMDSVYVTEIVHLRNSNPNNQTAQLNGRGARVIYAGGKPVRCTAHVTFDGGSGISEYTGSKIIALFDEKQPDEISADDTQQEEPREQETNPYYIPPFTWYEVQKVELVRIDSGDPLFQAAKDAIEEVSGVRLADTLDGMDPSHASLLMDVVNRRLSQDAKHKCEASKIDALRRRVKSLRSQFMSLLYSGQARLHAGDSQARFKLVNSKAQDYVRSELRLRSKEAASSSINDTRILEAHATFYENAINALREGVRPEWA